MKNILYTAGDPKSHKELGARLRELPVGEYIIQIKKNRAIRSLSANRYMHFAVNIVANHTGHSHDEIYEIAKLKFNSKLIHLPKGGTQIVSMSTKDLDTKEFGAFVNRFCQWALDEFGISIPQPGDLDLMKQIEIENQYERIHSGY
jgi:hypothetical protein